MRWIKRLQEKRARRAIRKLPKPDHDYGYGSYGMPKVHDTVGEAA